MASACYKLIMGADTATARKQFGPMFNDAPIGKLVDLYEGHGVPFSQWVREVYPILYDSNKTSAAVVSQAGLMAAAEP